MTYNPASLALDPRSLERLRADAGKAPEKALRDASKQFEVLFVNMLLKSMREAAPQNGPLDSDQTRMYTSMLDQQLAQTMSARGIGLADVMARQLSRGGTPAVDAAASSEAPKQPSEAAPAAETDLSPPTVRRNARARRFVDKMWPHAVEASRATGIPAQFILGQAALESGWGTREIRGVDGQPTHNLFGIKAGRSWKGNASNTATTEFVQGAKQRVVEKFRSYDSYAEAFRDYANMLKNNPRYAQALEAGNDAAAFARGLQQAGYATDPAYASKLTRVIMSSALRQGLSA
ncbi:MAG TPA: flagellar assembly peptidoglycan hydrolase FlgJ [Burkholderiales bacterium]|nr:flagellar assembly peptidoglycan hydrolase FlgJ [Burkholderiales bacterium]